MANKKSRIVRLTIGFRVTTTSRDVHGHGHAPTHDAVERARYGGGGDDALKEEFKIRLNVGSFKFASQIVDLVRMKPEVPRRQSPGS